MPRPQKPFKKEEVQKWYDSFKKSLAEMNIDISNPANLMRIKTYNFRNGDDQFLGNHGNDFGEKSFAFIPKTFNKTTGEANGYLDPMPIDGSEEIETTILGLYNQYASLYQGYLDKVIEQTKAFEQKDADKAIKLNQEIEKLKEAQEKKHHDFIDSYNKYYGNYEKWMLGKQKLFDFDKQYDQVEELYAQAMEGKLYVNFPDKNVEEKWQIVVGKNNDSVLYKAGEGNKSPDLSVSNIASIINDINSGEEISQRHAEYYQKVGDAFHKFEERHFGSKTDEILLPYFRKTQPQEVPKPTAWSWVKRIITFNIVKSDFTKYEQYQKDSAAYEIAKASHETTVKAQYNKILDFIDECKNEFEPSTPNDIQNYAVVEDNRNCIGRTEFQIQDPNPQKGVFTDAYSQFTIHTEFLLMNQIKDAPETIYPDGSLNTQATKEYWDKKGVVRPPVDQAHADKVLNNNLDAKKEFSKFVVENNKDAVDMLKKIKNKAADKELTELSHKNKVKEEKEVPELNLKEKNKGVLLGPR